MLAPGDTVRPPSSGSVGPEARVRDDREAGGRAEGGGREEPRRGDQLPQEDQPAAQGAARGNHLPEEVEILHLIATR